MQKNSLDPRRFHTYTSILVLALIAAFVAYIFWKLMLPRKDFYNELWGPAYLLVRGHSPYNTASLNPNLPAAWLPMSIGFFFSLGWLPETPALQVWYVFNILEICAIVYFVQDENVNLFNTIASALLCFFFPLTLNHINLGQFSITAVLCWVLALHYYERRNNSVNLSALLIALALSKPHLGMLPMLGLSYSQYARSGIRIALALWARILAMCAILCIPLFIAYPNWIPDMLISMGKNPPWSYPSLYILFQRFLGKPGLFLWVLTTLIIVAINFGIWKKLPAKNALYWSLALAPLATPYIGSWDFVVLFPLLISAYINADWKRKIFIWVAYISAWGLMARIQMMVPSHNHYFWWVPLWFIGVAILSEAKNLRNLLGNSSPRSESQST